MAMDAPAWWTPERQLQAAGSVMAPERSLAQAILDFLIGVSPQDRMVGVAPGSMLSFNPAVPGRSTTSIRHLLDWLMSSEYGKNTSIRGSVPAPASPFMLRESLTNRLGPTAGMDMMGDLGGKSLSGTGAASREEAEAFLKMIQRIYGGPIVNWPRFP